MDSRKVNHIDVPLLEALEPRLLLSGDVLITEFMADNETTLTDENNEYSDWLEIHNYGNVAVDLEGWQLEDDDTTWTFPSMLLNARQYRVIFASDKDRRDPAGELHTNFKLKGSGESLALLDDAGTIVHEYDPYPQQLEDISYGVMYKKEGGVTVITEQYFTTPRPGTANVTGVLGMVEDTRFSADRGFYTDPVDVEITTDTTGAQIRYTLDGSKPTATVGTVYSGPIHIESTTPLRAVAYKPGYLSSNVDTHTYIFLEDVLQQSAAPAGFPSHWNGTSANYAMDPNVVNHPNYSGTIRDDMQAVPTMSIVTSVEDMFGSTGIYANPRGEGPAWERPASVEWINTDGSTLFQVDGGVQIVGGASRGENTKKHSFRLVFKSIYGPTTLDYPVFDDTDVDSFNTITLRAGFNDRIRNTLLQDRWAAERQLATGGLASHGNFVHLYVDGLYWGLYNPVERPDDAFAASYLGGEKEDYDAYNIEGINAGTAAAWNELHSLANNAAGNYAAIEEMLDIPDFCDYLIVNQFGSNWDWPQNNWWATYNREGEGKWRFHSWDAEGCLNNGNRIDQFGSQLGSLYQRLRAVPEFKSVFADRAHRHLYNGGVLTPQANIAWLDSAAAEIYEAVVGESARWGNGYADNEGLQLRDNWASRINSLRNNYFPNRTWTYINQLKAAGLYPNVEAPSFRINGSYQHGGAIDLGDWLSINASVGNIYYTLDGTDPADPGGTAVMYGGAPLVLPESTLVKARTLAGEVWSALNEAPFYVHLPAEGDLIVTELNYHPQGPTDDELASQPPEDVDFTAGDFEFIELYNNGDHSIDLLGVSFSEGIAFEFGPGDHGSLAPGEFAVLVSNTAAFEARYGAGINVVGEYSLGLDSNGEAVTLEDPLGGVLSGFEYNDTGSWPGRADGKGAALEIIDPAGDYNDPANWRSSVAYGGTPGAAAEAPLGIVINEVLSHTDLPDVDSVELYNTTGGTIDIGGWYLSDSWGLASNPDNGNYKKFMIPPDTLIPAGQYLVFDEDDFNSSGGVAPLDFALSGAHGDDVWLMKADAAGNLTHFADHVDFGGAANGESFGRWPNGFGDLYPMTLVTLDRSNSPPRVGPLIISEIMYNPPDPDGLGGVDPGDLEFVEIYNPTGSLIELAAWTDNPHGGDQYFADWRLRGGADMEFDEGATIASEDTLVVLSFDPNNPENATRVADFRTYYGIDASVPLTGGYNGQLDDDGERIELQRPDSPPLLEPDFVPHLTEDEVRYADIAPWPISPDGSGDSLHRVHFEIFGDYAGSWRHDGPSPGVAPVFSMPPVVVAPVDDVFVDEDSDASVRDVSGTFDDPDPGDTLTLSVGGNTNPDLVTTDLTAGILTLSYVANINGTANIAVRATDPLGAWTEDTLTVTVTAINDAPPTVTDHIDDVTVDEDTVYSIVHLPGVFDDVDFGDTLAISVTDNTNTDLVAANIVGTRIVLSYVPDENGTTDITVRATDSGGLWVEDSFAVTVDPTNDAPTVASPIADVAVDEDAADTVIDVSNVFNDIDFGDTLSLSVVTNSNMDLVTTSVNGMNLTLSFVADQNGTADITIRATDSGAPGLWVEDTFTVTVDPVNDAPVMDELPDRSLDEDTSPGSEINLWRYVADVEDMDTRLTFSITGNTNPDCGVSIFANRALDFAPTPNWYGYSDVTIEVRDLDGATDSGTFRITINSVNDEPTVVDPIANVFVDEDDSDRIIDLSNVFDDVDFGDTLSLDVWNNSNPGLVTANLVGVNLTLSFNADQSGTADITVRATDSAVPALWIDDTFTVNVNPVNDAPTVSSPIDDVLVLENDPDTVLNLLSAFADVDIGDSLTLSVSGNTNPGLVTAELVGTQLTLSYLPDQSGTAEITVRATESAGPSLWVEDTFTVTVNSSSFAPIVANPISDMTVDAGGGDTVMYLSDVFADNFGVAPALDYTAIEIDPATGAESAGTGLFGYTFTLYGNDGADASFATTSLTFTGPIRQSTFNWNNMDFPAHDEGTADLFHSPPAYNKSLDTWRYNGWTSTSPGDSNLPPANIFDPGPQDGEDVIVSAFTGTTTHYQQKDLVYVVADGDVQWSGSFIRQGETYDTSGTANGNRLILSVEDNTNPALVTASMLGSRLTLVYGPGGGSADITIRATDPQGDWVEDTFTVDVTGGASAEVVGRHIFYNNSALDAGGDDDAAIDPVKTPLLPHGTASSDNYTSYSRGINGIMVDIDGLPGTPTIGDFGVSVNQAAAPDTWSTGPAPESVTVRPGEGIGGSDRVTLVWADGAILNQWVEITVLPGANTGLGAADVFYAGNVVGDSNDDGRIDAGDLTALVSEFGMRGGAELLADVNIDGRVNLTDSAIMRSNFGTSLGLPTMPPAAPPAATAAPALEPNVDILAESATSNEEDAIVGGDTPLGLPPVSVEVAPINLLAPASILEPTGPDDLLPGEDVLTPDDGLDAVLDADDLLIDMLAESALAVPL